MSDVLFRILLNVRLDTLERAVDSGDASRYFEQASDSMLAIGARMAGLAEGRLSRAEVLEDIEDLVDAWSRISEVKRVNPEEGD